MNRAINTSYNRPLALPTKFTHFKNKSAKPSATMSDLPRTYNGGRPHN